jgi:hypothetical protein
MCHRLNPKIRGVDFVINLNVLDSKGHSCHSCNGLVKQAQGIHRLCQGVCQTDYSRYEGIEYIIEPIATTKGVANCVKVNQRMLVKDPKCQWLISFPMSSLRN